jgi:hypothetical protein
MTLHGPCTLEGPVTLDSPWWAESKRKPRKRPATIRTELVARVKRQIAAGTYDTPERWEAALDQLARTLRLP